MTYVVTATTYIRVLRKYWCKHNVTHSDDVRYETDERESPQEA